MKTTTLLPLLYCLQTILLIFFRVEGLTNGPAAFLQHSRAALFPSTWPVDHADTARSKFALNGGLPENVTTDQIKIIENKELLGAQWIYTGGENSRYIYVINGIPSTGFFVNKLHGLTLEVLQTYKLQRAIYTGGMLMHRNGHVYCVYSNILYAFWNGDLQNATAVTLPSRLNGNLIMTNGMLVTQDGLLVIKQWSYTALDLLFATLIRSGRILLVVMAVAAVLVIYCLSPTKWIAVRLFCAATFAPFLGGIFWISLLMAITYRNMGHFDLLRCLLDGFASPNVGGGELKLVDPLTLTVRAAIDLPERCSYARMALSHVMNSEGGIEDAIILVGDYNVHQLRWRPSTQKLYWIKEWSRNYRRDWEGSFPGTGPSIYNDLVYFTDNTFPVYLSNRSYSMFSMSINKINQRRDEIVDVSKHYVPAEKVYFPPSSTLDHYLSMPKLSLESLNGLSLISPHSDQAGFMFWSVTIHPELRNGSPGHAMVWDTAGGSVQARALSNISELHWEIKGVKQSDCITSLPLKGHMYLSDYSYAPEETNHWIAASMDDTVFRKAGKAFLIVDGDTGREIVRKEFSEGVNPSLIVPGAHDDVIVGTPKGVARLYV